MNYLHVTLNLSRKCLLLNVYAAPYLKSLMLVYLQKGVKQCCDATKLTRCGISFQKYQIHDQTAMFGQFITIDHQFGLCSVPMDFFANSLMHQAFQWSLSVQWALAGAKVTLNSPINLDWPYIAKEPCLVQKKKAKQCCDATKLTCFGRLPGTNIAVL